MGDSISNTSSNFLSTEVNESSPSALAEKSSDLVRLFLEKLADLQVNDDELLEGLSKIYKDDFRHSYSDIAMFLLKRITSENYDQLEVMVGRLKTIHEKIEGNSSKERVFRQGVFKLYDHLNLELARIKRLSFEAQKVEKLERSVNEAVEKVNKASERANNMQKEHITILGIFAAIVLAFVAGLNLSASALSNIHQASIYRLSFMVCLIGLFIMNILHHLYTFIMSLNAKKAEELTWYKSYIVRFNLLIALFICAIFFLWCYLERCLFGTAGLPIAPNS